MGACLEAIPSERLEADVAAVLKATQESQVVAEEELVSSLQQQARPPRHGRQAELHMRPQPVPGSAMQGCQDVSGCVPPQMVLPALQPLAALCSERARRATCK